MPQRRGETHHKAPMSAAARQHHREASPTKRAVVIDGIYYASQREAARQLGIPMGSVRQRLSSNSPRWAGYQYAADTAEVVVL